MLSAKLERAHEASRGTYGVPRLHAELAADGEHVGKKRVARLMRHAGLVGISPRKTTFTTVRDTAERPSDDLVHRNLTATAPDQLWVGDNTYVPTWAGFLYLAVVLDVWSRRVAGWAMSTSLKTDVVLDALNMAVTQRQPRNVVHHSAHGCQTASQGRHRQVAGRSSDTAQPREATTPSNLGAPHGTAGFGSVACVGIARRVWREDGRTRRRAHHERRRG